MAHSMLTTKEMRLESKSQALPMDSSSSSPMVLVVESGNNRRSSTPQFKSSRPCYFARGLCHFGNTCVTSPNSGVNTILDPDINTRMNGGTGQVAYQATTSPTGFHIGPSAYYGYPTYPTA
nr:ribonuclease H-like domain-containing protein [Tanacetum cinerariifolium]